MSERNQIKVTTFKLANFGSIRNIMQLPFISLSLSNFTHISVEIF